MSGDLPAPPTGRPIMPARRGLIVAGSSATTWWGTSRDTDAETLGPAGFISTVILSAGVRKPLASKVAWPRSPALRLRRCRRRAGRAFASTSSAQAEALLGHGRGEREPAPPGRRSSRPYRRSRRADGPRWTIASGRPDGPRLGVDAAASIHPRASPVVHRGPATSSVPDRTRRTRQSEAANMPSGRGATVTCGGSTAQRSSPARADMGPREPTGLDGDDGCCRGGPRWTGPRHRVPHPHELGAMDRTPGRVPDDT